MIKYSFLCKINFEEKNEMHVNISLLLNDEGDIYTVAQVYLYLKI